MDFLARFAIRSGLPGGSFVLTIEAKFHIFVLPPLVATSLCYATFSLPPLSVTFTLGPATVDDIRCRLVVLRLPLKNTLQGTTPLPTSGPTTSPVHL